MTHQSHRVELKHFDSDTVHSIDCQHESGSTTKFAYATPLPGTQDTGSPEPVEAFERFIDHVVADRVDAHTIQMINAAQMLLGLTGTNVQDALLMLADELDDFTVRVH